jgi:hypothetical protein
MSEQSRNRPWQSLLTDKGTGQIAEATRQALESKLDLFTAAVTRVSYWSST